MKKTVVLSALALVATAGSSFGVVTMETRFLVQTTTGSGATYTVSDAGTLNFAPGSTVRLTIQYRITGADGATQFPIGLAGTNFSILGSGPAGGNTATSRLQGSNTGANQQALGEAFGNAAPIAYPATGAVIPAPLVRTGLHSSWRTGLTDPDAGGPLLADQSPANGVYVGDDINFVTPVAFAASFPLDGGPSGDFTSTNWVGLYSFNYVHSGAQGAKTFNFSPTTDAQNPNGQFGWYDVAGGAPIPSTSFTNGAVTLNFGSANTAPTVTPTNIAGSPDFTPAPDINNVLIGTITDAEGILAAQVSAAVMGAAPTNTPGFTFVQVDANTVQVLVSYEIANADLANGPSSFMVKITANDGTAPAVEGTANVNLVPAPGAAALLGLGGLLAARRRRQA